MAETEGIPEIIHGMVLSKSVNENQGQQNFRHVALLITRYGTTYAVQKLHTQEAGTETYFDWGHIDNDLTLPQALACAILSENFLLRQEWRVHDERPARAPDGLVTVARQFGIERKLVNLRRPHSGWIVNLGPPEELVRGYARNGLSLVIKNF